MPRLPQRHSLPAQSAEIILEMIHAGEVTGHLPGERTLAARLQIGRDTLRAALDILETQQIISPREHGKRRSILAQSKAASHRRKPRIAFISPKELRDLPPLMLIEIDILRELLNKRGYELEFLSPGIFHLKNPGKRLESMARNRQFDVWILHQCPRQVQRWFQENNLNTILRGHSNTGIELPVLDENWGAAAHHAAGVLLRHGHRSIGLLMPSAKLAGLTAAENGLRKALEQSNTGSELHTFIDDNDPSTTHHVLERALNLDNSPSAFVGTRSRHTLNILSWLAQQGMSIPKDISYIALSYEQWYNYLTPTISHYHSNPAVFARTLLRTISAQLENKQTQPPKLLIPEYSEGNSVRMI